LQTVVIQNCNGLLEIYFEEYLKENGSEDEGNVFIKKKII
jgi:hypothetical protein